jgi:hypothetical protein
MALGMAYIGGTRYSARCWIVTLGIFAALIMTGEFFHKGPCNCGYDLDVEWFEEPPREAIADVLCWVCPLNETAATSLQYSYSLPNCTMQQWTTQWLRGCKLWQKGTREHTEAFCDGGPTPDQGLDRWQFPRTLSELMSNPNYCYVHEHQMPLCLPEFPCNWRIKNIHMKK